MSSRNSYLSADERRAAAAIHRALRAGEQLVNAGIREPEKLTNKMRAVLREEKGLLIDYIEVADPDSLAPLEAVKEGMVVLVAVRLGRTRLIDNHLIRLK
jgi:pantoate--beta-alanine ligase